MIRALFLAFVLLVSPAYAGVQVSTYQEFVNALQPNAEIEVSGDIAVSATIGIVVPNVTISGNARFHSLTSDPVFRIAAQRFTMRGPIVWNLQPGGTGIAIGTARSVYLKRVQINTNGWGIYASGQNGGGLTLTNVHLNGMLPGAATVGLYLGQWDTVEVNGLWIEEHDTGIRMGWAGATANVLASSIVVDRARIGIRIDPAFGGRVDNVLIGRLWTAYNPLVPSYSGLEVSAALQPNGQSNVNTVRVDSFYASGFSTPLATYGTVGGRGLSFGWQ